MYYMDLALMLRALMTAFCEWYAEIVFDIPCGACRNILEEDYCGEKERASTFGVCVCVKSYSALLACLPGLAGASTSCLCQFFWATYRDADTAAFWLRGTLGHALILLVC